MWTIAYRCHHVDHMDVTTEYDDEAKAREVFDRVKEYGNLKFVRLEHDGSTVDYYSKPARSPYG